jgi:hypothetical protein
MCKQGALLVIHLRQIHLNWGFFTVQFYNFKLSIRYLFVIKVAPLNINFALLYTYL